jgi:hydroxymethylglutaryl-CoA reductase (NADPH)
MAAIIGAVVWCGELSLMAALTNQDELVRSHVMLERKKD